MNSITKAKAISALDGMAEIVRHEMMMTGTYVDDVITNERLARNGAICGGRKHCAIGSLWIGGGVRLTRIGRVLPGVESWRRDVFLRPRHGLRVAYNALNMAAKEYADRHGLNLLRSTHHAEIEALFEEYWDNQDELTKRDLLRIISRAKALINSSKVATGRRKTTLEIHNEIENAAVTYESTWGGGFWK